MTHKNVISRNAVTLETKRFHLCPGLSGFSVKSVIVAGFRRSDFPRDTEALLLGVAANQALTGLQQARLLTEQKRVADKLDRRVAQRTAELAAANEVLRKEVAERERAEQALAASEHNLRLIVDSMPPGLLRVAHTS
jgi:PAS domain-containing protein